MERFTVDGMSAVGATLDMDALARHSTNKKPLTQEELVNQFCQDDSIFSRMNRARKIAEEEPEKQKLISQNLWYFADKTLAETQLIFKYITEGRWKPDWKPPVNEAEAPGREEITLDEPEVDPDTDSGHLGDGVFEIPSSLKEMLDKRMSELGLAKK